MLIGILLPKINIDFLRATIYNRCAGLFEIRIFSIIGHYHIHLLIKYNNVEPGLGAVVVGRGVVVDFIFGLIFFVGDAVDSSKTWIFWRFLLSRNFLLHSFSLSQSFKIKMKVYFDTVFCPD